MIICIDNSDGKLYYALELLSFFNEKREDVQLVIDKKQYDREFLKLFPAIRIADRYQPEQGDIRVEITNQIDQPPASDGIHTILFPIRIEPQNYIVPELCQYENDVYCISPGDACFDSSYLNADLSIFIELLEKVESQQDLSGKKFLISAGPTVEDIDPVRFLTNRSSGKMGIALARAAFSRGAEVTLIYGPTMVIPPPYLTVRKVRSATEMAIQVKRHFISCDVYIGAAAIADYTPHTVQENKIKKENGGLRIVFDRTTDILKSLMSIKKNQIMVGFSLETENIIDNSRKKLLEKNLDMIIINNPKTPGAAFSEDTNVVTIVDKYNNVENLSKMTKLGLAHLILNKIKVEIQ